MGKEHAAHLRAELATAKAQGDADRVTAIKKHLAALGRPVKADDVVVDEAPVERAPRKRRTADAEPTQAAD